jgi:hypothetical protein
VDGDRGIQTTDTCMCLRVSQVAKMTPCQAEDAQLSQHMTAALVANISDNDTRFLSPPETPRM